MPYHIIGECARIRRRVPSMGPCRLLLGCRRPPADRADNLAHLERGDKPTLSCIRTVSVTGFDNLRHQRRIYFFCKPLKGV